MTRREFLRSAVLGGGALLAFPNCSHGRTPNREPDSQTPAYMRLEAEGSFEARIATAERIFERCTLCPRDCRTNRNVGRVGYCRAPSEPVVASHGPHFGEEVPLVGRHGSGTIFFANCNLRCVFCQNWPIAHEGRGQRVGVETLADMMVQLQQKGCSNINLVTPTHVMPNILAATRIALHQGFRLPLVYNTGGYERAEIVQQLEGVVDIYMPDLKFMDPEPAERYLGARDYPDRAKEAIREMYRQVGPLRLDENGLAVRGLLIRHLVMPNRLSNARAFVRWVAETLDADVYVNLMPQYRVEYRAYEHPKIARAIRSDEFIEAMDWAERAGLKNLDARSLTHRELHRRRR